MPVGRVVTLLGLALLSQQCRGQTTGPFTGTLPTTRNYTDVLPPLIPVADFYSDPQYDNVLISPSGRLFSYLAPGAGSGHLNVWVQDVVQFEPPKQITDAPFDIGAGRYAWSRNEHYILYVQNPYTGRAIGPGSHLFRAPVGPGDTVDMTPQLGNTTILAEFSTGAGNPGKVALGLIVPNFTLPGVPPANMYLADLEIPGELEQITENPGDVAQWILDRDLFVRAAKVSRIDGTWILRTRADNMSDWMNVFSWDDSEPSGPLLGGDMPMTFNANGSSMYFLSSKGFNTMHLLQINTETGEVENDLAHSNRTDVVGVVFNPATYSIEAASFDYLRRQWVALNPATNNLLQTLQTFFNGSADYDVMSMDDSGTIWSVTRVRDNGPTEWYIFNRRTRKTTFLFTDKPNLTKVPRLARMQGVVIPTPDGLSLPSYLTLPPVPTGFFGAPKEFSAGPKSGKITQSPMNLPLVIFPHPGPAARDQWGFHPLVQMLANRGYAVLQPNYRGSAGFGKAFANAGDGEWGLKMQDDLVTAVNWAIDQDVADPARVAIYGMQYGGYAALMGLTRDPSVFTCCAAALAPITNISYIADTFPAFANVSGLSVEDGIDELISPIYHLDNITSPLLVGEGAMNERMAVASSLAISAALDFRNIPNELFVYGSEMNGITQEPNRIDFAMRLEQFFAKYLGGRAMPPFDVNGTTVHPLNATQLMRLTTAQATAVAASNPGAFTGGPLPAMQAQAPAGVALPPSAVASAPGGGFLGV